MVVTAAHLIIFPFPASSSHRPAPSQFFPAASLAGELQISRPTFTWLQTMLATSKWQPGGRLPYRLHSCGQMQQSSPCYSCLMPMLGIQVTCCAKAIEVSCEGIQSSVGIPAQQAQLTMAITCKALQLITGRRREVTLTAQLRTRMHP